MKEQAETCTLELSVVTESNDHITLTKIGRQSVSFRVAAYSTTCGSCAFKYIEYNPEHFRSVCPPGLCRFTLVKTTALAAVKF